MVLQVDPEVVDSLVYLLDQLLRLEERLLVEKSGSDPLVQFLGRQFELA
jgi:hypothetical protein